jgi:hypothetical protein
MKLMGLGLALVRVALTKGLSHAARHPALTWPQVIVEKASRPTNEISRQEMLHQPDADCSTLQR